MKKIVTQIIAIVMILVSAAMPAYAAEAVDYSVYLVELRTLMDECEARGIPTDYELVSYTTIERFQQYINEDLAKGIDATCTNYEKACIDALYAETKENLEAYLAGTKRAFVAKRPDMNNLIINGEYVYDEETPVFSIGYGYFDLAKADIPKFQDFGVNNIQIEIGPTNTYGQATKAWSNGSVAEENDKAKSYIATSPVVTGNHSLYMQHNDAGQTWSAVSVDQNVVMTAGNYTLSFWVAGQYDTSMCTIVLEGEDWQTHKFNDGYTIGTKEINYFRQFTKTITIPEGKTNTKIRLISDGNCAGFYIDDISLVKEGTTENLIKCGGFEENDVYYPAIEDLKKHLRNAEEHNIAVSLLLSPHYFPSGLSSDLYTDKGNFIKYNVSHPTAKNIVEEHIRTVLSEVKDYDAIESICISNEPLFDTRWFNGYYTPLFVDFLYGKYGSLQNIKTAHNRTYSSDSDIKMPDNYELLGYSYLTQDALAYDFIEFNDKVFTDWHKWMADIVKKYMPSTPVHAKVMENMAFGEGNTRDELCRGTNFELLGESLDISGIDGMNFSTNEYYELMFLYDYLQSAIGKPIYNSETHIIKDYGWDDSTEAYEFSTTTSKKALSKMWQGAVHGRNLSTVWLWGREYADSDVNSAFYGSILFRPDLVDGIGKMNLDFTRLSDELVELQTNSDKVAIFYSMPSRLYAKKYTEKLLSLYEEVVKNGYDVGVVTEKSVDTLSKYDTLIIPKGATHTTQEALTAIQNFASGGGKVLRGSTDVLKYDEHDKSITPNISGIQAYSVSALPAKEVTLLDVGLDSSPTDVEWQYSITEDRILINAVNLYGSDSIKTVDVYYKGKKLTNMTELISGKSGVDRVTLYGYEPMLLEYKLTSDTVSGEADVKGLTFDDVFNKLYWEGIGEGYIGANIYKYNANGKVQYVGSTTYDTYTYQDVGTYIVRPVLSDNTEREGKVITTIPAEESVVISKINVGEGSYSVKVDNNTGNYLRCKVIVELLDETDNVIKYGYSKTFIAPNKSNELKLVMRLPNDNERARVVVNDDLNNCLASQEITQNR